MKGSSILADQRFVEVDGGAELIRTYTHIWLETKGHCQ